MTDNENLTPQDLKRRRTQRIIIVVGMALAILAAVGNIITGLTDWSVKDEQRAATSAPAADSQN